MSARLNTVEVARLVGTDSHHLSTYLSKGWDQFLPGNHHRPGSGERRYFTPPEVVVIAMLVDTVELAGSKVGVAVRAEFARQILAELDRVAAEELDGDIVFADIGELSISCTPKWWLFDQAEAIEAAAA